MSKTYLITGASSGLGLELAVQLAGQGPVCLILPIRNPDRADAMRRRVQAAGEIELLTPLLDLASIDSVHAFVDGLPLLLSARRIDGVLLNAGVQAARQLDFTQDGFEATFAVNHLAHHLLATQLLAHLAPGAAMGWTASGTHDPAELSARLFGFRGARYKSVAQLARGQYDERVQGAQLCRDAYATSKLCNVVSARAFASAHGDQAAFFSFDPGLMPGTSLAREQPSLMRAAWHHLLPRLVTILPGASTPKQSAAVLVRLTSGELQRQRGSMNGAYFDFRGRDKAPSRLAIAPWIQEDLMCGSDVLLNAGSC